jgi:hypothetical protein
MEYGLAIPAMNGWAKEKRTRGNSPILSAQIGHYTTNPRHRRLDLASCRFSPIHDSSSFQSTGGN